MLKSQRISRLWMLISFEKNLPEQNSPLLKFWTHNVLFHLFLRWFFIFFFFVLWSGVLCTWICAKWVWFGVLRSEIYLHLLDKSFPQCQRKVRYRNLARSRDKGVIAHKMVVTHFKESTSGKKRSAFAPAGIPPPPPSLPSPLPLSLTFTLRATFPDLLLERLPCLFTTWKGTFFFKCV